MTSKHDVAVAAPSVATRRTERKIPSGTNAKRAVKTALKIQVKATPVSECSWTGNDVKESIAA
jgi:hypothetical protein